ncbi:MAG: TspO/MBR family protein [Blastochloris sp.]|jgi:tryptophan-rich sensory protein|nr:TspO/MBR family protein [Blastochloris sp.]
MFTKRSLLALGGFVFICFLAAAVGGWATSSSVGTWYLALNKPSWTPPSWLFGPMWTTLYLMMAVSAWLVWQRRTEQPVRLALQVFLFQLIINACWSPIFFGMRRPDLGFFWIALLWVWIVITIVLFKKVSPLAALLLVPYLIWVSIAQALNFSIWRLNP